MIRIISYSLSFICWKNSANQANEHPIMSTMINKIQNMCLYFLIYLNITSALVKAKQVLFSLPVLSTIFCIYLYLLSIEELGLSGVGGLPTPFSYTTRSPYHWTHILISLYLDIWISVFRTLFA